MIYLVEDDSSIRELVIYALNSTGLEAKGILRNLQNFGRQLRKKSQVL